MAALFSLAQDAMRTLTGRINQNNRDAVRIATPMATIGIRGSDILTAHVVTTNTTTNAVISGTLPVNTVIDMVTVTVGQATATVALTQTQLIAFQAAIAAGGPFGGLAELNMVAVSAAAGAATSAASATGAAAGGLGAAGAAAAAASLGGSDSNT